jgi:hypothetical protein
MYILSADMQTTVADSGTITVKGKETVTVANQNRSAVHLEEISKNSRLRKSASSLFQEQFLTSITRNIYIVADTGIVKIQLSGTLQRNYSQPEGSLLMDRKCTVTYEDVVLELTGVVVQE